MEIELTTEILVQALKLAQLAGNSGQELSSLQV
jgi:hypothetical protein